MDVDEVVDEVLQIEQSMLEDMNEPEPQEAELVQEVEVEEVTYHFHNEDEFQEVAEVVTVETEVTDESDEALTPETHISTDAELSPPADGQEVTFLVQLNDGGAILLDKTGVVPTGAENHVYFPIKLPATKVKSAENPLVGAKHFPTPRSRKTKPQATLYNDEIDQICEMLPDGSVSSIATSSGEDITPGNEVVLGDGESMDVSEFTSRLLPKDFELMENILGNQEVFEISGPTKPTPQDQERRRPIGEVHNDHTYAAPPPPKTVITVISDGHAKPKPTPPLHLFVRPPSSDPDMYPDRPGWREQWREKMGHVGPKYVVPEDGPPFPNPASPKKVGMFGVLTQKQAMAQARRSQRQQDRVERQEAERILAENQQMLQREKELYAKGPISPASNPDNSTPSTSQSVPVIAQVDEPGTPPGPTKRKSQTEIMEIDLITPPRPYPKRQNRKLPAHLADPNYVNLDESEKKPVEGEDDEEADPGKEKEVNEDDPEKLWCICRKPHNNRFMICCDTCEDWFHGKCVGITKAKGSKLDKWVCPNCRKKKKVEMEMPVAQINRRRGSSLLKSNQRKNVKGNTLATPGAKGENDKTPQTPAKPRQRKTTGELQSPTSTPEVIPTTSEKCIICKTKPSRKDSIFCSDECVVKHSHEAGSSPVVLNASPTKLKRSTSKVADKEEMENFLTFHLISAGTPKSTVVVPPKPKDGTPSKPANSTTPTKSPSTSESTPSVSPTNGKPTQSTSGKRGSESQGSRDAKRTKLTEATPVGSKRRPPSTRSGNLASASKSSTSAEGKAPPKRQSSESKDKDAKSKQKETDKPKNETERQKKETEAEIAACRETSRSRLTEVFESRLKELSEVERSEIPAQNTPESISMAIEVELFNSFSSVNNKYRNKFRSILFNLKDSKNNLYKTISMGELKPKELVKLEPHQLASDELAQWRINESKKELEMIKRSEIDKLEELKKQELIDAELGFEKLSTAIVEDEVRLLGTPHKDRKTEGSEGGTPARASTRSSSRHTSSHHGRSKSREKRTSSRSRSHSGKKDEQKRESSEANESSNRRTRSSGRGIDRKTETPSKATPRKDDKKTPHKTPSSSSKNYLSKSTPSEKEIPSKVSSPKEKESERNLRSRDRQSRSTPTDHKRSHREGNQKNESSRSTRRSSSKSADKTESKRGSNEDTKIARKDIKDSPSANTPKDDHGSPAEDEPISTQSGVNSQMTAVADPNLELRVSISIDSTTDQEVPSSTIKTPDFTTEEIGSQELGDNAEAQKAVLEASFTMPELGSFNALLYNVSHFALEGMFFPSSPVPIVGRIPPTTVWDYIDKMKKSKEVIILRLAPATPADTEGYMTFFTYFSSRTRIGVLGGIVSPLKDVYLVPLDKHSPVNKVLLPLHGPGLPKKRAHCLLAVITRHSADIPAPLSRRKLTSPSDSPTKRMKLTSEIKPGLISSLNLTRDRRGVRKSPENKYSPFEDTAESSEVNDDDLPYTPWEDEEGSSPVSTGVVDTQTVQSRDKVITEPKILMDIQQLEAQIQVEQAAIQNMEMAIIAKATEDPLLIPGLDGEFAAEPSGLPSFLRSSGATRVESSPAKSSKSPGVSSSMSLLSGEGTSTKEAVSEVEDDAPYSPSQLDLDEES